jgi:hypothetical protein
MARSSLPQRVLALLMLAFLGACASGPRIVTNAAPGFDVTQYRTFGFLDPLSTDRNGMRTIESQELIAATARELEARGLSRDDANPDMHVNFMIATREKIESRPTAGPSMYYGRARYGTWGGYGMGMGVGTTTEVVQRTEGTLSIDLIDADRKELVWEGSATARVTDEIRENRRAVINSAVSEIFAQFP